MPLIETKGAASAQGFGLTLSSGAVPYIEDVFSTYLYTGTGATQTITNGIDLSGKGGLVWFKNRPQATMHALFDTARGVTAQLITDDTNGSITRSDSLSSFNSTGFTVGPDSVGITNASTVTYVSWTFREQPKFFDVVTYTGNGSNRTISHNLGSVPGCIIVKRTDAAADWQVYHRSLANTEYLVLNTTAAKATGTTRWNSTTPTSTVFSLGTDTTVNANGGTYVAYLFAHDAGGFGLTGSDNVISCGYAAGGTTVNLGYEPQWVLTKNPNSVSNWLLVDNMRGMPAVGGGAAKGLLPNTSGAESDWGGYVQPTSTGFYNGVDAIYIAIRRGPMKVPTSGTSVFSPVTFTASGTTTEYSAGFPIDLMIDMQRNAVNDKFFGGTRLTGLLALKSNSTAAEQTYTVPNSFTQNGFTITGSGNWVGECLGRAPGFFDVVCYTGNFAGNPQIPHNLGVAPELLIAKRRDGAGAWYINSPLIGTNYQLAFNASGKSAGSTYTLTSTYFQNPDINYPTGGTFIAYLFASCPGVSKVGSYTGTGALQTVNCGFTGGARFVLIKRTDSTGDWYVYDSARGISSGNDPYLLLNSTDAEVTGTNYVDTTSVGFQVTAAAPAGLNASGGSFVFLAIA